MKQRKYKDPLGPNAWLAQVWAPMYNKRYGHPPEYGAKPTKIVKSLFSKMGEMFTESPPEEIFDVLTKLAECFIDREAFDWISHRDLASLNGNLYRVNTLWQEESDGEENTILDDLYGLEERILTQTSLEVEGSQEVLALEQRRELAPSSTEPI
jgi:hypothetical protein